MLETLLNPRSVAVIGASRHPGKVGYALVDNLIRGGYAGRIIPVNPSAEEILGQKCCADLASYPDPIDLAVIAVPVPAVRCAVECAAARRVPSVIVVTAGFKEVGPEGARKEEELVRLCRERGVRLMGPNCLGLINTHHLLNATFAQRMPRRGGISLLSQSGALCTAFLDGAAAQRLGLAKLISIGNKADLNEIDFLRALAEDGQTKVIVGYLESIASGEDFVRAAEETASVKPVVLFKAGTTPAGIRAAALHTGSMAGTDIAYSAAFRRAGVIRAETYEALFDYARAFEMQPLPRDNRVAILTNAGGPGIISADAVEGLGLRVAELTPARAEALRAQLPPAACVENPVDVLEDADAGRYELALKALLEDEAVDSVLVILTPQAMTQPVETALAIAKAARKGGKPVLTSFMGGWTIEPGSEALAEASIPDYPTPQRAAAALAAMWEYASWKRRPPRVVTRFPVHRRRVERIIARHERGGQTLVSEVKGKEILQAYDFAIPPGHLVMGAEEAVEAADRIGYPVALKIVSPDIIHKSHFGGVKLSLGNPDQVRDAYDLMMLRIRNLAPQAVLEGVYVEKMCPRGREFILGMSRDPQFGPMLMFGIGGIFVEVMKDVTFHLAPLTAEEAMQMLMGTRSYGALIKEARGRAPVDVLPVAGGLQRMSQLVTDFPQISEIDINPFIVSETGSPPVAVDVHITLCGKEP